LQERGRIDARVIVRQKIERHRRDFRQQFVEHGRGGGGRNVVAMSAPDRGFLVPQVKIVGLDMTAP